MSGRLIFGLAHSVLALLVAPLLLCGRSLPAQRDDPHATRPAQQQREAGSPTPRRRTIAHTASEPVAEAIASRPPASPPADPGPKNARISWDRRGLEIEASDASLNQILRQVAADTGITLEGLIEDQRVFGSYGPGPRREVLLKLLDGAGYNVLMFGGGDDFAPLAIVLSARLSASPQTAAKRQSVSNSEEEPVSRPLESETQQVPPNQNPFSNGGPPRDPMQFMQEILQRQQKIDQQQQQQKDGQNQQPTTQP